MAVTYKSDALLEKLGIPKSVCSIVKGLGVEVTFGVSDLKFKSHGKVLALMLPTTVDSLLKKTASNKAIYDSQSKIVEFISSNYGKFLSVGGTVPAESFETIVSKGKIQAAPVFKHGKEIVDHSQHMMKATLHKHGEPEITFELPSPFPTHLYMGGIDKASADEGVDPYALTTLSNAKAMAGKIFTTPHAKEPVKKTVALKDADHVNQVVVGSSPSSRYTVVAIADTFKIAAKRDGAKSLSVRVEGSMPDHVGDRLNELGITYKNGSGIGKSYWSGHYTMDNTTPEKLLGAVLFGLGVTYKEIAQGSAGLLENS